jgi:hypothetical protein
MMSLHASVFPEDSDKSLKVDSYFLYPFRVGPPPTRADALGVIMNHIFQPVDRTMQTEKEENDYA